MASLRNRRPVRLLSCRATKFAAVLAVIAASISLPACSQSAPPPSNSAVGPLEAHALSGTILRVTNGKASGELRITEESGPDAPGPPYPACLTRHTHGQRVVNFDLNWAGINFGAAGAAPALVVTITGPDGSPLIVNQAQDNPQNQCRIVRALVLDPQDKGSQLVYGLALKLPSHAKLTYLWVTADGHLKKIQLSKVCSQSTCFQDDPPLPWQGGTSYSPSLTI